MHISRALEFVAPNSEAYSKAILIAIQNGARGISIYPATTGAKRLAATLSSHLPKDVELIVLAEFPAEPSLAQGANRPPVFVLMPESDEELPELLLKFLDWEGVWIIAPKTARFYANNPLFLISIPKAGTHLLYELARQMGYGDGVELTGFTQPAHWYCLEYSNSHTAAPDFFIDSVRRNPFGNRTHPFPRTPALFIYRNPLDILVSEANYYHRDGKASFSGYLSNLAFEQRVERLISDPWLLGSIRDRIAKFVAWLEFSNVIPISYEELVGTHGGGDDRVRESLVWSLQLKLQVPGRSAQIAGSLLDQNSPTFHKGKIGGYREALSDQAFADFYKLDQDFMRVLGYADSDKKTVPFPPARAEEFRRRLLRLSAVDHGETPVTVGTCLGCNLVTYRRRFYAVPQNMGRLNLAALEPSLLQNFVSAGDLGELRNLLLLGRENYEHAWQGAPQLLEEGYLGFNLIAYGSSIWAARMKAGPIDFSDDNVINKWLADGRLFRAATVEEARKAIYQLRHAR